MANPLVELVETWFDLDEIEEVSIYPTDRGVDAEFILHEGDYLADGDTNPPRKAFLRVEWR